MTQFNSFELYRPHFIKFVQYEQSDKHLVFTTLIVTNFIVSTNRSVYMVKNTKGRFSTHFLITSHKTNV